MTSFSNIPDYVLILFWTALVIYLFLEREYRSTVFRNGPMIYLRFTNP